MRTKKPHPIGILLGLGLALGLALPAVHAQGTGFRITMLQVAPDGTTTLAWQGRTEDVTVQYTATLNPPVWQAVPGTEWPIRGNSWTGQLPRGGHGFIRLVTKAGESTIPVPAKTISLDLMAWHDPESDSYINFCTVCHGTKAEEKGLDGETPSYHSLLVHRVYAGEGDEGCRTCHQRETREGRIGPDFLNHSAGGLRRQVNVEENLCTTCHGRFSTVSLYVR
ncbi:MAG: hypothetical protein D6766_09195 [Verrucomicrobia bacterium]|nr:MAG: hypothetical protein D6766_09195 [Verrucomicrobiota bacterium]